MKKKIVAVLLGLGMISAVGANPGHEHKVQDPWQGLHAAPAPILVFGGESFFPVEALDQGTMRRWEFVRDGEDFTKAGRFVVIKMEKVQNLRAYEKALMSKTPIQKRDIHYRSSHRLVHSWLVGKGDKVEFRLMEWLVRPDGLQCCEIVLRDGVCAPPPQWRKELQALVQQAPRFLPGRG